MPFIGIRISGLRRIEPGLFLITYRHRDFGSGRIVLDEETLAPVDREVSVPAELPAEVTRPTIDFDGIRVKTARDLGSPEEPGVEYLLRWEALSANHDRPRQPPLPPASRLELIRLEKRDSTP